LTMNIVRNLDNISLLEGKPLASSVKTFPNCLPETNSTSKPHIKNRALTLKEELAKETKVGRPSKNFPKFGKINVEKDVAKKVGVSHGQLYKIQKIYDNEKKIPETVKNLDTLDYQR